MPRDERTLTFCQLMGFPYQTTNSCSLFAGEQKATESSLGASSFVLSPTSVLHGAVAQDRTEVLVDELQVLERETHTPRSQSSDKDGLKHPAECQNLTCGSCQHLRVCWCCWEKEGDLWYVAVLDQAL